MTTYVLPSAGDLAKLRDNGHRATIFASFLNPDILWGAQISTPGLARGETTFDFVAGSGTDFTAIEPDMPIWVGSSPGLKNVGILRVRSISSADGGVTGTITVARHTLPIAANHFLIFVNDHPLMPKYPLIVGDPDNADFRKDGDIPYTNENDLLHPIVIAGPHRADFIDTTLGYWEVTSQLPDSYPMTPGATLTTFGATCVPNTGVTISINAGTGVGFIRFATPGQYWVKYSVTDSNGVTQISYRYYYAHSTDPTSQHYPHTDFELTAITGDWQKGGWTANTTLYADANYITQLPDKTLAIIWAKPQYDNAAGPITLLPDQATNLLTGYARQETLDRNRTQGIGRAQFTIESIEAVLASHYMFSISLEAKNTTPTAWYEFRNELTNTRAVHHLWKWHSTLLEMTDVIGLMDNADLRAYAELEDGNLYSMADDMIRQSGIRYHVVADQGGRLHTTPDIQLLTDAERAALPLVFEFTNEDQSEDITIIRNPVYRTPFVKTSGFYWDGSFITTETEECPNPPCPDVEAFCASSPTTVPADEGPSVQSYDRQTFRSQAHANEIVGRFFAQVNNLYPEMRLSYHGNYGNVLDVAYPLFWRIDIPANTTPRAVSFNNLNLICRNVTLTINTAAGTILTQAVFEPEFAGLPGVPAYCVVDLPPDGGEDPGNGYGPVLITGSTGSSVYYGYESWVQRTPEDTIDLIQDPWWRIKQNSFNPADAIILRVGDGYLKWSDDAGVNWSTLTPITDPPNTSGDTPAPTAGDLEYHFVEGNRYIQDEFIVMARWQNGSGAWRSWILYTDDNFVTYTWESLAGGGSLNIDGTQVTGSGHGVPIGSIVYTQTRALSSTYVLTFAIDDTGTFLILSEVNGDIITVVDTTTPGWTANAIKDINILKLVDDKALVTWHANPTAPTEYIYGAIVDVTGGTLVASSEVILTEDISFGAGGIGGGSDIALIGDSAIQYAYLVYGGVGWIRARQLNITGPTVTAGSPENLPGTNGVTWEQITLEHIGPALPPLPIEWDDFLLTFIESNTYKGVMVSRNPFFQTTSSITTLDVTPATGLITDIPRLVQYTEDSFYLAGIYEASGLRVVPIYCNTATSTISTGTAVQRTASISGGSIDRLSNNAFGLNYVDLANPTELIAFSISGSGLSLTDNADDLVLDTGTTIFSTGFTRLIDGRIVQSAGVNGDVFYYLLGLGGSDFRSLGGSISKGTGDTFYLTGHNGSSLVLRLYDILTLVQIDEIDLGTASEAEVDANTYIAYPWADYFDDDICYVFGRMNNPQGLGLAHIIVTTDAAISFVALESGWGASICSALISSTYGSVFAIKKDNANYSSLYVDFLYKSKTGFAAGVNPHGLKVGGFDDLYMLADAARNTMVLRCRAPYTTYGNLTGNHGTSKAGMALEVL